MAEADIDALVAGNRDDLVKHLGADGEAKIRADTAKHFGRYARVTDRILQNFVQFLRVYAEGGGQ